MILLLNTRFNHDQPPQVNAPELPQEEDGGLPGEVLPKEAIMDKRLIVFFDWQVGHSGESTSGSEKRISFSNSSPQLKQ
jgi:hypothetical protein